MEPTVNTFMADTLRAGNLCFGAVTVTGTLQTSVLVLNCSYVLRWCAGLLVMHAHAADPLQAYGELFRSASLPPLMRQGVMEPQILKHYLLLHDDAVGVPWARQASRCHVYMCRTLHYPQPVCKCSGSALFRAACMLSSLAAFSPCCTQHVLRD